jgi:hypothetical protein
LWNIFTATSYGVPMARFIRATQIIWTRDLWSRAKKEALIAKNWEQIHHLAKRSSKQKK